MRRLILAALMGLALGNGCIIQIRDPQPEPIDWGDPGVIPLVFDSLGDLLERIGQGN